MGIQITLFKALRSAKVGNDDATAVVEELEGHIAMKITDATAPLIAKLDSTQREIASLKWMIGTLTAITLIAGTVGGYIAAIIN